MCFFSPHRLDGLGHFPFTEITGIRIPLGVYEAGIAQLVERGPSKSNVACSNHVARFTIQKKVKLFLSNTLLWDYLGIVVRFTFYYLKT